MRITTAQTLMCLCGLLVAAAGRAHAQATAEPSPPAAAPAPPVPVASTDEAQRTAIARAAFEEGLQFVDAERWADAADRFARVLDIRYSAVAAYNFALAQARLGKLVMSAETLRKLLADSALDIKVRDPALALQHEVDSRMGWLLLRVDGDGRGCTLEVDEREWPSAAWGVAAPTDPGAHAVVFHCPSLPEQTRMLDVQPGARVEETLHGRVIAPSPAQVAASSAPVRDSAATDASEPDADRTSSGNEVLRNPWFWVAVGAVVAAGVTTAIVVAQPSDTPAKAVKGNFTPSVIEGVVMP